MSLSNPNQSESPIEMYISWKGADAHFEAYDKAIEEKVDLGKAIGFVVLDMKSTVVGFTNNDEPIRCNICKQGEVMKVTALSEVIAEGRWADIKEKVKGKGGKYCLYLYVMLITAKNEKRLAVLKIFGSGFGNWIDLKHRDGDGRIIKAAANAQAQKKGNVTFYSPTYSYSTKENKEAYQKAIEMDKELQGYFKGLAQSAEPTESVAPIDVDSNNPDDNEVDDLPF